MTRRINNRSVSSFFLLLILNVIILPEWTQRDRSSYLDDPINSVTEFVMEVCLDFEDLMPGDERDEEAPFSNYAKHITYFLVNEFVAIKRPVWNNTVEIPVDMCMIFSSIFLDVNTPPPEMA